MKSTGIVRRIDDLGRVVIPKEIRRTQGIREGDPMEIFVNGDSVVLKKYIDEDSCTICLKQSNEKLLKLDSANICISCAHTVKRHLSAITRK